MPRHCQEISTHSEEGQKRGEGVAFTYLSNGNRLQVLGLQNFEHMRRQVGNGLLVDVMGQHQVPPRFQASIEAVLRGLDIVLVHIVLGIQVGVDDPVPQSSHQGNARAIARQVRRTHVSRYQTDGSCERLLVELHLFRLFGRGDRHQVDVRVGVRGDLVPCSVGAFQGGNPVWVPVRAVAVDEESRERAVLAEDV